MITKRKNSVQAYVSEKHFLWIKISQDNLKDPVVWWYCPCKAGARTVGHVATIIWYLGKGKHSQYKPKSDKFSAVKDAAVVPQTGSELELDD